MTGPGTLHLASIREEEGAVVLTLSTGEKLEVAPGSVPAGLPEAGELLDPVILEQLREAAERKKIARRLFTLLDRRLRPVHALRSKLLDEEFSAPAIDAVLEQMRERGLYSDRTFADAWCRDSLLRKAVGRGWLISKLRQKRVDIAIAREAAAEALDDATEAELALTAAERKWAKLPAPTDRDSARKTEAKVIRHLQSRGFAVGLAVRAMRETKPDEAEDEGRA